MYSVKKIISNKCPYVTKDKYGERVYVENLDKRPNQQTEKELELKFIKNLEEFYPKTYKRFTELIPEDYIIMLVNDFIYKEILDFYNKNLKKKAAVNDNRKSEEVKYNQLIGIINEALVQIVLELQGKEVKRIGSDSNDFWKGLPSTTPDLLIKDKNTGEEFYCDVKYKDYLQVSSYFDEKNKDKTWNQIDNEAYKIGIKEYQLESYINKYNAKILVNHITKDNKMIYFIASAGKIDRSNEKRELLYRNKSNKAYNKYGYRLDYMKAVHKVLEFVKDKLILNEGYISIFTYDEKNKNKKLEIFDDRYKEFNLNEFKRKSYIIER